MTIGLFVSGGVYPDGVRVIPVLVALIERLARRHEVVIFALSQEPGPSTYEFHGATVIQVSRRPGGRAARLASQVRQVVRELRARGPFDLLHAFGAAGPGPLAAAAGRLLGIPVVVSIFGGEMVKLPEINYGGALSARGRLQSSFALHSAHAVTCPSRHCLQHLNGLRQCAAWIPLGVEAARFAAPMERRPGPPWRLLNVGDLNLVKDHGTLMRAIRLLRDKGEDVHLDVFGLDTLDGRLQWLAEGLGITAHVTFHGHQPLNAIIPHYRGAHLFVQSSLHESMGAALLEAAAAGLPTVGTRVGLLAEMAPECGIAVPPNDAEALARAVESLLHDERRRQAIAAAAQGFARRYDADWSASALQDLYVTVLMKA